MCGICGATGHVDASVLRAMTATLIHRGPDDQGFHDAPGIGLGVRRLSIIDVPGGHQPISNEDGSVTVAFNGEIYNHRAGRSPDPSREPARKADRGPGWPPQHSYQRPMAVT